MVRLLSSDAGRKVVLGLLCASVVSAPLFLPQFKLFVVSLALVYTIAILGVNIAMGYAGQISLGHAGFAALGAYSTALLMVHLDMPFWLAVILGGLITAIFGYLLAFPALKLGPVYVAMVTFGFGLLVFLVAQNWLDVTNGPNGLVVPTPTIFGHALSADRFHIVLGLFLIALYWLAYNLINSSYGRAFVAIRESQLAAEAMGIHLAHYKTIAFAVGAFYAGLSGGLFAALSEFVNPDAFMFMVSILYVTMGLLGGLGYLAGAAIGGTIMAVLPEVLRGAQEYKDFLTGLMLLLLLIFLPRGVMGWLDQTLFSRKVTKPKTLKSEVALYPAVSAVTIPPHTGQLLEIHGLTKDFGGLRAVADVSFQINQGEILSLIGSNGAGKTTVFNLISGVHAPTNGSIVFCGRDITHEPSYMRTKLGVARTFQNLELFSEMTVIENVMVGAHSRVRTNLLLACARTPGQVMEEAEVRDAAMAFLAYVGLEDYADQRADSLSFGHQRLLEIARALASKPTLIMLDEPTAGLSSGELEFLGPVIRRIRDELGITVLLICHTMRLVMSLSDRIVVLDQGRKIAEGRPAEITADEKVVESYLGAMSHA